MWKIPIRNYVEKIKTGEIVLAVPPLSDTIGPSFSLGIITSVATLNRVKRAKATKADHPLFLQLFEEGEVIFLFFKGPHKSLGNKFVSWKCLGDWLYGELPSAHKNHNPFQYPLLDHFYGCSIFL